MCRAQRSPGNAAPHKIWRAQAAARHAPKRVQVQAAHVAGGAVQERSQARRCVGSCAHQRHRASAQPTDARSRHRTPRFALTRTRMALPVHAAAARLHTVGGECVRGGAAGAQLRAPARAAIRGGVRGAGRRRLRRGARDAASAAARVARGASPRARRMRGRSLRRAPQRVHAPAPAQLLRNPCTFVACGAESGARACESGTVGATRARPSCFPPRVRAPGAAV